MKPTNNNSRERADRHVIIGSFGQNPKLSFPEAQVIFRTLARSICGLLMLVISTGSLFAAEPSTLSINDVSVTEGNHGVVVAVFTVSLSEASEEDVTVRYRTVDDSAKAEADYVAASGIATIAAGKTSAQIIVMVHSNVVENEMRTFSVELSDPLAAALGRATGRGTIVDDDSKGSVRQ